MVERSSTTVIHNVGSRSDRAIGAAVTVGVGVILAQFAARYLRQDSESWLDSILDAIKSWMDGDEKQSVDLVIHSAACHCRSVVFEFRASPVIIAKDGNGKINYPHVRVQASDFCILSGGEMLQMYYILVPAKGSATGVTPITAAFTFCSRCGVHVVHAPSAQSNMLDVNVDCLDSDDWKRSKTKDNLSQGVSVADQWEQRDENTISDTDFESGVHFFSSGPLTALTGGESDFRPINDGWRSQFSKDKLNPTLMTDPGTPNTVSTGGTGSHTLLAPARLYEGQDAGSENSSSLSLELPPTAISRLPPPIDTSMTPSAAEESKSSHTTPMMRDQLKYYMSKHVSPTSGKKRSSPVLSTTPTVTATVEAISTD